MMNSILKWRWVVFTIWVVGSVVLFVAAPNMEELVREKGQISVPEGYSSTLAAKILDEVNKDKGTSELQTALVFHSSKGLTEEDIADVKKAVEDLKNDEQVGVSTVTTHFDQPELEEQLVAKDGKTILVAFGIQPNERSAKEIREALTGAIQGVNVEYYYTGSWLIDEDVVESSQEGLKKTEFITLFFILGILLLVFKSVIAPIIPLVTVGLSYVASQSIVAFLVNTVNFPLSTFTQIFMVAVLFGIGTDYCILLISRFKEELAHGKEIWPAIVQTYRTAGKTVFFSGLAVMVGFASIGMSQFVLYRSAVAVAVGIAVLLLALVTVVPFFMAVLGKKLFWPSKGSLEHKESKLWGMAGSFSLKRPLITLLIVAAVVLPFLVTYDQQLSFNSLDEIGDSYDSVKAFNIISDSFGPGESLPATIVMKHDEPMDNATYLAIIEKISREVEKVDGIKAVRSASRPVGEKVEELQVSKQVEQLDEGLGEGKDGIVQISDGLSEASKALTQSAPQINDAVDGVQELITGTSSIKSGIQELSSALSQIQKGIQDGSIGAGQLKQGLEQMKLSAEQLAQGNQALLSSYKELEGGLGQLTAGYGQIEQNLNGVAQSLAGLNGKFDSLLQRYPELKQDQDFLSIQGTVNEAGKSSTQLSAGLQQLNEQLSRAKQGLNQANNGFTQASEGQSALAQGFGGIIEGIAKLQEGLEQAAAGQGQVVANMPSITNGLEKVNGGQQQLHTGFAELGSQLSELTNGLQQSVDGLNRVSEGLGSAQDYLSQLSSASDRDVSGWFVPNEVLENEDFQQVFDAYMSPDRKVVTLDVVFSGNPYAVESLDKVADIEAAVNRAIKGTELQGATFGINGVTSIYSDLDQISESDYTRTVVLMLAGIFIILVLMLRSFIMPIYLIASLVLTYYTSMGITEAIFVNVLGYSGISWAVPFFAFVMLVALGIDYSIFLMDRFNEYREMPVEQAILLAMKKMGTVIISAVVILGGTFAAMYPSGVLSLLQIATIVLSGLVLYALLFLPFFVPVMVKTFGNANWWPFLKQKDSDIVQSPDIQLQPLKEQL